jgi:hypothetical protein
MSYLGHNDYDDYARNSFKTIFKGGRSNGVAAPNKSVEQPKIDIHKEDEFPTLGKQTHVKDVPESGGPVDYKKAISKCIVVEETMVEVVPPGWVKYTFDKKTKKIEETKGEERRNEEDGDEDEDSDAEEHYKLQQLLKRNRERHQKSFIACHGEEYYKDQFFIPSCYGETDSSSDASDLEQ